MRRIQTGRRRRWDKCEVWRKSQKQISSRPRIPRVLGWVCAEMAQEGWARIWAGHEEEGGEEGKSVSWGINTVQRKEQTGTGK